jgi:hypothetical protein
MTTHLERSGPGATTDRSPSGLCGTWTIDPATSIVSFAWRALRRWTITDRWHGVGMIHLDALPAVGVIRFRQPSGLPFLTMASDPTSLEPGAADRQQQWWWRLRSHSLEVLPGGAWRVMATLTTHQTLGLVELRLAVDPEHSRRDRLVLWGRGVLDRRTFPTSKPAWSFDPTIRLDLAARQTSRKEAG